MNDHIHPTMQSALAWFAPPQRRTCLEVQPEIADLQRRIAALRAIGEIAFAEHLQEDELAAAEREFDAGHDSTWFTETEGDPGVIGGTRRWKVYRCRNCEIEGASMRVRPEQQEA